MSEHIHYDLGCGLRKEEQYTGVDILPISDIQYDLSKPHWDFAADNSADSIKAIHFIEHLDDLIPFFNECHRILKPGGELTIISPYYTSVRCWQDPTHKRAISEGTFFYFSAAWRKANDLEHYPITADFEIAIGYYWDDHWMTRSEDAKMFALKHYHNVVNDIQATLTKWA